MPTTPPKLRAEILSTLEHYEHWEQQLSPDSPESLYVLGGTDALRIVLAIVDGADHHTAIAQAAEVARLRHLATTSPTEENRDR